MRTLKKTSLMIIFIAFYFILGCRATNIKHDEKTQIIPEIKPLNNFDIEKKLSEDMKIIAVGRDKKNGKIDIIMVKDGKTGKYILFDGKKYAGILFNEKEIKMIEKAPTGDFWLPGEMEEVRGLIKKKL